jgi:hypothetical protein
MKRNKIFYLYSLIILFASNNLFSQESINFGNQDCNDLIVEINKKKKNYTYTTPEKYFWDLMAPSVAHTIVDFLYKNNIKLTDSFIYNKFSSNKDKLIYNKIHKEVTSCVINYESALYNPDKKQLDKQTKEIQRLLENMKIE